MFLDNTACNLASLNLGKFYDDDNGDFDLEAYRHAIRLWTMVLEISVTMAHFPSKEIAQGSYDYRTLGLGYANLGSLLMRMGIPYDSRRGPGHRRCADRHPHRLRLCDVGRDGRRSLGPFAKFAREPRVDAAGDAQPSQGRLRRRAVDVRGRVATRSMGIDPSMCARRHARRGPQRVGHARWSSASSTATATPRRRCWRRPAPSAC